MASQSPPNLISALLMFSLLHGTLTIISENKVRKAGASDIKKAVNSARIFATLDFNVNDMLVIV